MAENFTLKFLFFWFHYWNNLFQFFFPVILFFILNDKKNLTALHEPFLHFVLKSLKEWKCKYNIYVRVFVWLLFLTHCLPVPFVCLTPPVLPVRVSGLSVVQATRHRRDGLTAVGPQPRRIAEQPWNEGTQRLTRCTELCEWTACSMCVGPFPVAAGAQPHRKNSSVRTTARSQPRQCKAARFTP